MVSMIPGALRGARRGDLEKIEKITRLAFPEVPNISTAALADRMVHSERPLLLVDVRSPEEFAVSHLPGAVNLGAAEEIRECILKEGNPDVVLYCAVGFRSARVARELARAGIRNCANLEGSIFAWANEGRPIYRGQEPVREVYCPGKRWKGLLAEEIKVVFFF